MKKVTFLIVLLTLFFSWYGAAQNNSKSSSERVELGDVKRVIKLDSDIPQGISPNGDNKNDTFDLSDFNVARIEIFNRLGKMVYSKNNYTNEWYGQTNKGEELPVGTYFYTMVYEGGTKTMSSWVYVNR